MPRAEYLPGIDIDLLHSDIECAIIRRSNYANGGTFHTDSGVLREDAIADEAEEVLGLSLILLGGEFQIHHIGFVPIREGQDYWKGEPVYFFELKDCYVFKAGDPIFFPLQKLHKHPVPFHREENGNDKPLKKLIAELNPEKDATGKYVFYGSTEIKHEPTMLNYWHLEFIVKDAQGKVIKRADKEWKKEAVGLAFNQIITGLAAPQMHAPAIRESHYTKS